MNLIIINKNNMGWFNNALNNVSNVFPEASQFVSDAYGKVKDVGNFVAKRFDLVSLTLDTISITASSVLFISTAIQEGFSDLRVATVFDSINNWVQTYNKMLQNNPYEGMISDFANKVKQRINTAKDVSPTIDRAVGMG